MRVIIRARKDLLRAPIAEIPALDRMSQAWASCPVSDTQIIDSGERRPYLPSIDDGLLWVEGIFPFLTQNLINQMLRDISKGTCIRALAPGMGRHGIAFFSQVPNHLTDIDFADSAWWEAVDYVDKVVDPLELQGLHSAESFSILNDYAYQMTRDRALASGVFLIHPDSAWIGESVDLAPGVIIHPQVVLRGSTRIGSGCVIHCGSVISDSHLSDRVCVKPYSVIDLCRVGSDAQIGPFAHLRPHTVVGNAARIGNFVETKKATLGDGTKASHLSYIGDAKIGKECNIGAGTITCNYDGFNKNQTVMGDRVFIGSDSQLVAPVELGDGAYVAAGSTITSDVPGGDLAIARARQKNKPGFAEKIRQRARHLAETKNTSETHSKHG